MSGAFLLAYFLDEGNEDGEAVRFALSEDETPLRWIPLAGGRPILRSTVGERGARDPFLLRTADGEVVLLATDLRVWPTHDWNKAVRHGSRSLLVTRSADLVTWSEFDIVQVASTAAGNVWAPKAFWSDSRRQWLIFWASSLFRPGQDRTAGEHQRMMVASTTDFRSISPAEVYLDRGRDVIDMTFLSDGNRWFRFSVDQRVPGGTPEFGHHPFQEVGSDLMDPDFAPFVDDVGKFAMERGEGPAVARSTDGNRAYLLIDEYGLRGYQLFETDDLNTRSWRHRRDAALPLGARHGSLLAISDLERDRMLDRFGR